MLCRQIIIIVLLSVVIVHPTSARETTKGSQRTVEGDIFDRIAAERNQESNNQKAKKKLPNVFDQAGERLGINQESNNEKAKKKPLRKSQIDNMENFADVSEGMEALQLMVGSLVRKRKNNCLKAFGNEQFCNCLNDNLPIVTDFIGYIKLITSTKDEIGYRSLSEEHKAIVDKVYKVRDQCVDKIH